MDKEREQYFEIIPTEILDKLKPFSKDIGEVLRWSTDFAHQKYHNLDMLLHFRHFDRTCYEQQGFVDNLDPDDLANYPNWTNWWDTDLTTYDLTERAIRLHDTPGRIFVEKGVLKPEEHHYGSLFVAMHVDSDPRVWQAVFRHTEDVLPQNSTEVDRLVRDLDRIVGSGYVGLIRIAKLYGYEHSLLEETNEDKVVTDGIMMAIPDRFGRPNELKAKEFFWDKVYPFFESQGGNGIKVLGTTAKILLDRLTGRDYTKLDRVLTDAEEDVLRLDNDTLIVEKILPRLMSTYDYKVKNTLEVLVRTRGGNSLSGSWFLLSQDEVESYLWPIE